MSNLRLWRTDHPEKPGTSVNVVNDGYPGPEAAILVEGRQVPLPGPWEDRGPVLTK